MKFPLAWRSTVERLEQELFEFNAKVKVLQARLDRIDVTEMEIRYERMLHNKRVDELKVLRERRRIAKTLKR